MDDFQRFNALLKNEIKDDEARDLFLFPVRGSFSQRLSVYREGFWIRAKEVLDKTFPATKEYLGDRAWNNLGSNYISTCFHDLNRNLSFIGSKFSSFLRDTHEDSFASSLSDLEWKLIECSEARNEFNPQSPLNLQRVSEDSRFVLNPTFQLFESKYSVVSFWSYRNLKSKIHEFAVLNREENNVRLYLISEPEWKFLSQIASGQKLGLAAELHSLSEIQFQQYFLRRLLQGQILPLVF